MWIPIQNWETLYAVNEYGEVINLRNNHIIVGDKNSVGYQRVTLYCKSHNPPIQRFFRHRLVAIHFIPNPHNYSEVNHLDLNIDNNHVSNLEWTDRFSNERHSRVYGRKPYKPFEVRYSDDSIETFHTTGDLATKIGVTRGCIKNWLQEKTHGYKNFNIASITYI